MTEMQRMILIFLASVDRPRTLHKHRCGKCWYVFEHMTPPPEATKEEYHKAHDCPRCGNNEREVYES